MRTVLHSDLNNFYATVECVRNPSIANKPVVICGDKEARHGIVLAKNRIAKAAGIKTGEVIWEAKQKCPDLVEIQADFKTYLAYSEKIREIYNEFTDKIEPFGIDECWLDVTGSRSLFGSGEEIANLIKLRIKELTGLTVSIGVSFNKIFAKLASDQAPPDSIYSITKDNFRERAWRLPVENLLYVGRATQKKLNRWGIRTIGDLAGRDLQYLKNNLGQWGLYLYVFSNGLDDSPVLSYGASYPVKSIGNSLTNYRDVSDEIDVTALITMLCESVAERLRESGIGKASVVHFYARDNYLSSYGKQKKLPVPSMTAVDFIKAAKELWRESVPLGIYIRSIGISISDFTVYDQMTFENIDNSAKQEKSEIAVDRLRKKYGSGIVQRASATTDEKLNEVKIKDDHVIHPEGMRKS